MDQVTGTSPMSISSRRAFQTPLDPSTMSFAQPSAESHSSTTLANTLFPLGAVILIIFPQRDPRLYQRVDNATMRSELLWYFPSHSDGPPPSPPFSKLLLVKVAFLTADGKGWLALAFRCYMCESRPQDRRYIYHWCIWADRCSHLVFDMSRRKKICPMPPGLGGTRNWTRPTMMLSTIVLNELPLIAICWSYLRTYSQFSWVTQRGLMMIQEMKVAFTSILDSFPLVHGPHLIDNLSSSPHLFFFLKRKIKP